MVSTLLLRRRLDDEGEGNTEILSEPADTVSLLGGLGVMLLIVALLMYFLMRRRSDEIIRIAQLREQPSDPNNQDLDKNRLEQLKAALKTKKYEVEDEKIVKNDSPEEEEDCVDHEVNMEDDAERSCHDQQHQQCAICLVDFEKGDEISWSDCEDCQHHFHRTCILKWLLKHNECPSCRRPYLKQLGREETGDGSAIRPSTAVFHPETTQQSSNSKKRQSTIDFLFSIKKCV